MAVLMFGTKRFMSFVYIECRRVGFGIECGDIYLHGYPTPDAVVDYVVDAQ